MAIWQANVPYYETHTAKNSAERCLNNHNKGPINYMVLKKKHRPQKHINFDSNMKNPHLIVGIKHLL